MEFTLLRNGIWDLLREVSDDVDSIFRPLAEAHSLTMIQLRLLIELRQAQEYTIGTLSKAVGLIGANTSAMCKRLEKEGFLERVRDKADERVVKLALTQKGKHAVDAIEETLQVKYGALLKQQDTCDLEAIYFGMKKLSELLMKLKKIV